MAFDKQTYFSLLYEDPIAADDYLTSHQVGVTKKQFAEEYQDVREGATIAKLNAVNYAFAQKHPELVQVSPEDDLANSTVITKIVQENNLPYNMDGLETAFNAAKEAGELKLGAGGATVRAPDGRFVSEKEFERTAPLDQLRKYYENKHPDKVRR